MGNAESDQAAADPPGLARFALGIRPIECAMGRVKRVYDSQLPIMTWSRGS